RLKCDGTFSAHHDRRPRDTHAFRLSRCVGPSVCSERPCCAGNTRCCDSDGHNAHERAALVWTCVLGVRSPGGVFRRNFLYRAGARTNLIKRRIEVRHAFRLLVLLWTCILIVSCATSPGEKGLNMDSYLKELVATERSALDRWIHLDP